MKERKDHEGLDPRLHAWLDGELSSSDAAAFEEDLHSDDALRHRLTALQGIEEWSRATRTRAPSTLLPGVLQALSESTSAPTPLRAVPGGAGGARSSLLGRLRIPLGLAAAAALALFLVAPLFQGGEAPPGERVPGSGVASEASDPATNTVRYTFQFRTPEADKVCLAGDFNSWKVCETPLQRVGEDLWSVSVELPRGRHEYMFVVDGRWVTDPNASFLMDDGFGNKNAVLSL